MPPRRKRARNEDPAAARAAQRFNASNHNAANSVLFNLFPGEIRNMIYQQLIDDFILDYRDDQRARQGIDPDQATRFVHPTIQNARAPLVLTPRISAVTIMVPGLQAAQTVLRYRQMKQDLVRPAQLSQQFMAEFRSMQRAQLEPFIRWEELGAFMNVFYPSRDPVIAAAYRGRRFTIVFPFEYDRTTFDVLPMLKFFRLATHIRCNIWAMDYAVTNHARYHGDQIRDSLFMGATSLRAYLGLAGTKSIEKIMFRAHVLNGPARVDIWFKPPVDSDKDLCWVDGQNWAWPVIAPSAGLRASKERAKKQSIWNLLNDTGLNVAEIRTSWHVRLKIEGMYTTGGRGVA